MGFLSNVMKFAPTALGAGTGYIISGGNPMGAAIGGALASQAQNYMSQERNLNYQKKLQGQIFAREDNAVRRRVQDLQAAGLSKVLGAGQSADAGAVVSTHAPQLDMSNALALLQMKQNIDMSQTQQQLVKAQTEYQKANSAIKWHDYEIFKKTGTTSSLGGLGNSLRNIFGFAESPIVESAKKELQNKIPENIRRMSREADMSKYQGETYLEKWIKNMYRR